jgi:hypothetical protein
LKQSKPNAVPDSIQATARRGFVFYENAGSIEGSIFMEGIMDIRAFEIEMTRLALFYAAASLIGFLVSMWVLYIVIKSAVRDGLRESGLVHTWARAAARATEKSSLPDMRAER